MLNYLNACAKALALLTVLSSAACDKTSTSDAETKEAVKTAPRSTVWIRQDGRIELDGRLAELGDVEKAIAELKHHNGTLLYGRDTPLGDPHPNAMHVIRMVTSHRVAIRMSTKRDFSDAVGSDVPDVRIEN